MKRAISILFLTVIIFQSFSCLFVVGSFYLNRNYISENLCVNRFDAVQVCKGKCFLVKELKAKEQQQQKLPDVKLKLYHLFCEENAVDGIAPVFINLPASIFISKNKHYPGNYLSSIFHPPRVA